jgi:hypothetical protein
MLDGIQQSRMQVRGAPKLVEATRSSRLFGELYNAYTETQIMWENHFIN